MRVLKSMRRRQCKLQSMPLINVLVNDKYDELHNDLDFSLFWLICHFVAYKVININYVMQLYTVAVEYNQSQTCMV